MPKNNTEHIMELQMQRKKLKTQSAKYTPTHIYLQVLGNGTRAESRALFLITDHTNYLFNCGEGTQRLATEHHAKLTKIENIFLTSSTWDNMGGIPGLALTIQDTGVSSINLHGPDRTIEFIKATQNFVILNQLTVTAQDTTSQFSDQTMSVTYLRIRSPKPPVLSEHIDHIMVYICKVHPKAGTLDMAKCKEVGIKPGPHLGQLKAGEDITLPDGRVVKSKDVVSAPEIGPIFIVLECPDEDWIDVIVENPAFLQYQEVTADTKEDIASYIVHFTPASVLENPAYRDWMLRFGSKTQHLIINEESRGYCSEAMHKMQHQLHLIDPNIFPLFEQNNNFAEQCKPDISAVQNGGLLIHQCETLNSIHLRPNDGLDKNSIVRITPDEYVQDVYAVEGFSDSLANLQNEVKKKSEELGNMEDYPRLVMLGTGASIPNKIRNTSGMLFQLNQDTSIVLDCGEATLGQIIRLFGISEADRVLKTIKAIYVSHLHADHHLGLIGILRQRKYVNDQPVFLLAPQRLSRYLNDYHNRFESIEDLYELISNDDLLTINQTIFSCETTEKMYNNLGITNISTTYVKHCPDAYAVAITLNDGKKICYSGDTMPCDNMTELAKGAYLLIHEATMEDDLKTEALIKRHSTISQAVSIGVKANVNFTLLTHFSQRYSKIPRFPTKEESSIDFNRVGIAFDFMKISFSQLTLLPLFYPSLKLMFCEFTALLDERAHKRKLNEQYYE